MIKIILTVLAISTFAFGMNPSADSHVSEKYPNDNYGQSGILNTGDYFDDDYITYIDFRIVDNQYPNGTLYLYYTFNPEAGNQYIYKVSEMWSEDEITWNNKPALNLLSSSNDFYVPYYTNWLLPPVPYEVSIDVSEYLTHKGLNIAITNSNAMACMYSDEPLGGQNQWRPRLELYDNLDIETVSLGTIKTTFK